MTFFAQLRPSQQRVTVVRISPVRIISRSLEEGIMMKYAVLVRDLAEGDDQ